MQYLTHDMSINAIDAVTSNSTNFQHSVLPLPVTHWHHFCMLCVYVVCAIVDDKLVHSDRNKSTSYLYGFLLLLIFFSLHKYTSTYWFGPIYSIQRRPRLEQTTNIRRKMSTTLPDTYTHKICTKRTTNDDKMLMRLCFIAVFAENQVTSAKWTIKVDQFCCRYKTTALHLQWMCAIRSALLSMVVINSIDDSGRSHSVDCFV